jgi:hypothetical protein
MGAFSATALDEALLAYAAPEPVKLSQQGKKGLEVIETLKKEAD